MNLLKVEVDSQADAEWRQKSSWIDLAQIKYMAEFLHHKIHTSPTFELQTENDNLLN